MMKWRLIFGVRFQSTSAYPVDPLVLAAVGHEISAIFSVNGLYNEMTFFDERNDVWTTDNWSNDVLIGKYTFLGVLGANCRCFGKQMHVFRRFRCLRRFDK